MKSCKALLGLPFRQSIFRHVLAYNSYIRCLKYFLRVVITFLKNQVNILRVFLTSFNLLCTIHIFYRISSKVA